jgi:hypothetical protein
MAALRPGFDALYGISLGWHSGYSTIQKHGRNPDVDATAAVEDIWAGGGSYTGFPTGAAETLTIVSSSANDAAAGTGLRTLYLDGLDANGAAQTETVTMNGLTEVVTSTTWTRVNQAIGLTAGSGGTNAGTITIKHTTTTANVFASLIAGWSRSTAAIYTVPANATGLLLGAQVGASNNAVAAAEMTVVLRSRLYGSGIWLRSFATTVATGNPVTVISTAGTPVPARTDIAVQVIAATADNLAVTCTFQLILVPS